MNDVGQLHRATEILNVHEWHDHIEYKSRGRNNQAKENHTKPEPDFFTEVEEASRRMLTTEHSTK